MVGLSVADNNNGWVPDDTTLVKRRWRFEWGLQRQLCIRRQWCGTEKKMGSILRRHGDTTLEGKPVAMASNNTNKTAGGDDLRGGRFPGQISSYLTLLQSPATLLYNANTLLHLSTKNRTFTTAISPGCICCFLLFQMSPISSARTSDKMMCL